MSFWVQTVALFWAFFAVRAVWFAIGRFNIGYQVLNPAVENLAEVVQLGRGNALPLADAVNGAAADVVAVDQCISAKVIGASAVLLICALLDTETIRKWIEICDSLGLSALVEAHTEEEVKSALDAGARVIGVNNRNLKDFTVDLTTCTRLRKLVPKEILFVGESGIKTAEDVQELREAGVNGLLIGETLMRNADKKKALEELNGDKL